MNSRHVGVAAEARIILGIGGWIYAFENHTQ